VCDNARTSLISALMMYSCVMNASCSGVSAWGGFSNQNVARRTEGVLNVVSACTNCAVAYLHTAGKSPILKTGYNAPHFCPHDGCDYTTPALCGLTPW
jgi:hypothetical protein